MTIFNLRKCFSLYALNLNLQEKCVLPASIDKLDEARVIQTKSFIGCITTFDVMRDEPHAGEPVIGVHSPSQRLAGTRG